MLSSLSKLVGFSIRATDGEIGKIDEFYFDDLSWVVRYMVVNTDNWVVGRQVLISPVSIGIPDEEKHMVPVALSREQVRNSPDIDTSKPVYRQHETALSDYYQWPLYWTGDDYGGGIYGMTVLPPPVMVKDKKNEARADHDPHLRSTRQVTDYRIQALDGEIGHVEDFLIDQHTWAIYYLVVKTRNWLPGKKVLISPRWLKEISWADQKVYVEKTIESVKTSPEYDPSKPVNVDYEDALHRHYGWHH